MASSRRERERKHAKYVSAKEKAEKAEAAGGFGAIKLPKGVPAFKFEENKTYRLDILPYKVGKGNPYADYDPDDPYLHYERTYWTHKGIGADEKSVCCLSQTFKKACPICEYIKDLDRWGKDKDLYQALRPKQRQLFALIDCDDRRKGVQILEMSFFFGLGEAIDGKCKAKPQRYDGFYHAEGGKTLEVAVKRSKQGGVNIENVEMEDREEDIDQEILDKVPCLDDMPIETDYKTMKKMFETGGAGTTPDEVRRSAERNGSPDDSDVDSDEDDGSSPVERTTRAAKAVSDRKARSAGDGDDDSDLEDSDEEGSSPAAEDSSDEESSAVDSDVDSDAEDEDSSPVDEASSLEEPAPKKGKSGAAPGGGRTTRTKSRSDDSDVDSSLEEPSDEEPAPSKKKAASKKSSSSRRK